MSQKLRLRADRVKRQGELERRNWNPSADSAHYRVYQWWKRQSGKWTAQENFCHYWRVVFIWAPLRLLGKLLPYILCAAILGVIVWATATYTQDVLGFALTVVLCASGVAYLWLGFHIDSQLLYQYNRDEYLEFRWPWMDTKGVLVKRLLVVACLPACMVVALLMLALVAIVEFFAMLHEKYNLYQRIGMQIERFASWCVNAHFSDNKWLSWIRPWLVAPATVAACAPFNETAFWLTIVGLLGLGLFGLMVLAAFLTDRSRQRKIHKRRQRRRQQYDLILEYIFQLQHPERRGKQAYDLWFARYEEYCYKYFRLGVYDVDLATHLRYLTRQFAKASTPQRVARTIRANTNSVPVMVMPTRLQRFWQGTGDFLVLAWSVVLTKKWKICPRVVLPR